MYACSRNGFQATVDLHQATYGRTLYVFDKIPIAINFSIGRQINQRKGDNVVNFARLSITSNHDHCNSKLKSILVEHLTDDIFEDTTRNNMKQLYSEIVGVIPRYTNAAGKGSSKDAIYSGLIVLHKMQRPCPALQPSSPTCSKLKYLVSSQSVQTRKMITKALPLSNPSTRSLTSRPPSLTYSGP